MINLLKEIIQPKKGVRLAVLSFVVFFTVSCKDSGEYHDLSSSQIDLSSLSKPSYTNHNEFEFEIQFQSLGHSDKPEVAVAVYENDSCLGSYKEHPQKDSHKLKVNKLKDGKIYSFRVLLHFQNKSYRSECTHWVGVDQQKPDPIVPVIPPKDMYVTEPKIVAHWNPTNDNGIAGLKEKPYRIKLFAGTECTGTLLKSLDTDSLLEEFAGMDNGSFYSYQVSAIDKAGNESTLSCSPHTEIDLYAPGLKLTFPGADSGFTKEQTVAVSIENDSWARYWCLTTDADFNPASPDDACPGGYGDTNGWHTTQPTSYTLTPGDGLKNIYLWILDSSGKRRTDRHPLFPIVLDQTLPSAFAGAGITGGKDTVIDEYIADDVDPIVHWNPSSDANLKQYIVEVLDEGSTRLCQTTVSATQLEAQLEGCGLTSASNYRARVTAVDYAGNFTTTADYLFSKDITPPGAFTLTSVQGVDDPISTDDFLAGAPIVSWTESEEAVSFSVRILNPLSSVTMCEESLDASVLSFDFNSAVCLPFMNGVDYQVIVTAYDRARIPLDAVHTPFTFTIDHLAPSISFASAPLELSTETDPHFDFTVSDTLSGVYSLACSFNGAAYSPCSSPVNFSALAHGFYQLDFKYKDNAGNEDVHSYNFEVDRVGPTMSISSAPNAFVNTSEASVVFSAIDAGSAGVDFFECSLDDSSWTTCVSPHELSSLPEGLRTLQTRATDSLGNLGSAETHSWMVDLSAPAITLSSTPADSIDLGSVSYDFTVADTYSGVNRVECQLNSGEWTACTSPKTYTKLVPDDYTFRIRSFDNVGNESSDEHAFTVVIQVAAPLAFTFTNSVDQEFSKIVTSDIVAISGITGNIATSISGNDGEYRICEDSTCTVVVKNWTSADSTVQAGQFVQLRQISPETYNQSTSTTFTAGTYTAPEWKVDSLIEFSVTIANSTNLNIQDLFTASQWSHHGQKRVVIPEGVTVGATSSGGPALRSGQGRGGLLVIENAGSILGAGGAANGGAGGTAFLAEQSGVKLINTGYIYGGGGGGGKGGNGGAGSYTESYVQYEPADGSFTGSGSPYSGGIYWGIRGQSQSVVWSGMYLDFYDGSNPTVKQGNDGWTYQRNGTIFATYDWTLYQVRRYRNSTRTVNTTGGAGGDGGRGYGYDGGHSNGLAGVGGGTNAGAGGAGGSGASSWGTNGNAGSAGTNGNSGAGVAGGTGGLAGFAVQNYSNVTLVNSGTLLGRQ